MSKTQRVVCKSFSLRTGIKIGIETDIGLLTWIGILTWIEILKLDIVKV